MSGLQAKNVLVPFDYSDRCVNAVRLALKIIPEDGTVVVAHAMVEFYPVHPAELYPDFTEEAHRKHAESKMTQMLLDADVSLRNIRLEFLIGDSGSEIATLAKTKRSDLIVVPSHGRRGFRRMMLGSVAERIARLAPCPVLIVKEKKDHA